MSWASLAGSIGPADLGHPQRHSEVLEQREGVAELVAVERPLRLADHHGVKAAVGVGERGQELGGLGPALRRDRAGLVDVEELGNDHPAVRLDERLAAGVLPGPGGLGVLPVLGGYPLPGREPDRFLGHRLSLPFLAAVSGLLVVLSRVGLEQHPEQGPGRRRGERWRLVRQHHAGRVFGCRRDGAYECGPAMHRACEDTLPGAIWEGVSRAFLARR